MLSHSSHLKTLLFLFSSISFSIQCFSSLKWNNTYSIFFVYKLLVSPVVCKKVAPCVPICVAFHPLLINLPPFADSFVSSTRNRFQLFMPIFHKYLGDGISKQTMPGDTNPRLQQRSFNALEIWPAVDRHLLLSSAASQQQCWHSKYVYRSGAALTLRWGAGIRLKERSEE